VISSLLELIVVSPLGLSSENSTVGNGVRGVRLQLKELVSGLENALVVSAAVSNNDLRGILVGHNNCCLREA